MKTPDKIAIVGAGGIACYLAPQLCRLAPLVIVDKDNYEPKNSSRQWPALYTTENKAIYLAEQLGMYTHHSIEAIPEFLQNSSIRNFDAFKGVELIIGCVDNHASRHLILDLADSMEIPAILAGNESRHGEAHLFVPDVYDPRNYFPFEAGGPTPWSCNSDQALEADSQTAIANMIAAGTVVSLYNSWIEALDPVNAISYLRVDAFSIDMKRILDFANQPMLGEA